MEKRNRDLRAYAKRRGVWLWRAAERVGISDYRLSRLMRRELSPDLKTQLLEAIDQLAMEDSRDD